MDKGEPFRQSVTTLNLRCVIEKEQAKVLEEVHFDEYSSHLDKDTFDPHSSEKTQTSQRCVYNFRNLSHSYNNHHKPYNIS